MLVRQSRIGHPLKVAGASARRGTGFEYGDLYTANGQGMCGMSTGQACADDQSASSPHGLGIHVPGRQGSGQRRRAVNVAE